MLAATVTRPQMPRPNAKWPNAPRDTAIYAEWPKQAFVAGAKIHAAGGETRSRVRGPRARGQERGCIMGGTLVY